MPTPEVGRHPKGVWQASPAPSKELTVAFKANADSKGGVASYGGVASTPPPLTCLKLQETMLSWGIDPVIVYVMRRRGDSHSEPPPSCGGRGYSPPSLLSLSCRSGLASSPCIPEGHRKGESEAAL